MTANRSKLNIVVLLAVTAMVVLGVGLLLPPIPQDPAYHDFVDQREIWGVPNFWNVLSNLPFLIVGILGCGVLLRNRLPGGVERLRTAYLVFFLGVGLVAFGSAGYHLSPSNGSLVWDRLPMTLGFMGFFSALVGERISVRVSRRLLWPALTVGLLSVAYWHLGEQSGSGDLRPYVLVQFLPILLTPMILLFFPSRWSSDWWLWAMLSCYLISKLAEVADRPIFATLGVISGHSIKHLLAALGAFLFLLALRYRMPAAGRS